MAFTYIERYLKVGQAFTYIEQLLEGVSRRVRVGRCFHIHLALPEGASGWVAFTYIERYLKVCQGGSGWDGGRAGDEWLKSG